MSKIKMKYKKSYLVLIIDLLSEYLRNLQKEEISHKYNHSIIRLNCIIDKFIGYKEKLDYEVYKSISFLKPELFYKEFGENNKVYFDVEICIELSIEDCYLLYFHFDSARALNIGCEEETLNLFKIELAKKIAIESSRKYIYG